MASQSAGIGARLRAGREKLGLTVLQVAERIHTDPKIVEAIEGENFPALGAPVYARGHIRHYAELVGESPNELISLYSDQSRVAQPDLTQIVKAPSGSESNKLVLPALVVIAVFAIAGAIWWVSALSKKKPQLSETHVVGQEQPASAGNGESAAAGAGSGQPESSAQTGSGEQGSQSSGASTTAKGAGVGSGSGASAGGGSAGAGAGGPGRAGSGRAPTGSGAVLGGSGAAGGPAAAMGGAAGAQARATAGGTGNSTSAALASAAVSRSNGSTMMQPNRAAGGAPPVASASTLSQSATSSRVASATPTRGGVTSASVSGATGTAPVLPRAKNQVQVTLRYSADSWTEVYDASGARLFYDVGSANSIQTVVGTPPLRVVLGNASGVAVEFNGHSTPIAKLAHPDGSVQFSINRSGHVIRAKPVADGG